VNDTLEVTVELADTASIVDGNAVVRFARTEAAIATLRAQYPGATYDLATTKGNEAARAARKELVTLRTSLERRRKELKEPAVEFSRRIDSEAKRLTGEIVALEDPIDAQIKADEARREQERAEREAAELARIQGHTDRIAEIRQFATIVAHDGSARIAAARTALRADPPGDDYEEWLLPAQRAHEETLAKLDQLHAAAVEREAQAAAEKAEREAEAARLKAEREALARERAEAA
jgi:Protein of unknown function (DUF1351)